MPTTTTITVTTKDWGLNPEPPTHTEVIGPSPLWMPYFFHLLNEGGLNQLSNIFFQPETSFHFFPFIFPSSFLFFLNLKNLIQKLKVKSRGALAERDSIPELGLFAQLYLSPLGIPRSLRDTALKTLISCSALFYVISKPQSVAQC